MQTRLLRAAGAAVLIAACNPDARAGIEEIPVTTQSATARMDFIAGQAALDRGDAPEANVLFRAAVAADPNFSYAWLNLATVSFSTKEFSASLKHAADTAAKASDGERLLVEINQRFLDGNFNGQLELAKQLVEKYPASPRAWLALGGVEFGLNHFADQRTHIAKAMELDPHLMAAPFALGGSYLFNEPRDFALAEEYYRQAIAIAPGEDNLYWSLGDVYRGTNRLDEARQLYELATQLDPSDGTALLKLGHVNSFLGHYDEARADYDRGVAVAEASNKPFFMSYKMFTWVHAGDAGTAVRELEKLATEVDTMDLPDDQRSGAKAFALTNAATICLERNMNDEADRVVSTLAGVLRGNARAVGTEEFSRIQEAQIAYYEGQLAAHRGDYKVALALAKKNAELVAPQQNPRKMENYHDLMGLIYFLQRKYAKAVEEYRLADLTNMYNKYHLALALDGARQKEEARKIFKEVAEWNFNTVGYALVRQDALARAG
ncbi:MAG: tetratricopeptide repeat protein [Steroidobacterales bacterium]